MCRKTKNARMSQYIVKDKKSIPEVSQTLHSLELSFCDNFLFTKRKKGKRRNKTKQWKKNPSPVITIWELLRYGNMSLQNNW